MFSGGSKRNIRRKQVKKSTTTKTMSIFENMLKKKVTSSFPGVFLKNGVIKISEKF